MSLTLSSHLGSHVFQGPFTSNQQLPVASGVYAITTLALNQLHTVLDVGESHNIQERISVHERSQQWSNNVIQGLYAWVYICDERTRMALESALRLAYNPVCGIR